MKILNKITLFLLITIFTSPLFFFIFNKNSENQKIFLKILNSEDYINPEIIKEFEQNNEVKIIYDTFDTQENMFNIIKTNKTQYDLICISDYMFPKIISYDKEFIIKLNKTLIPNYYRETNPNNEAQCSNFIKTFLQKNNMFEKTICYMWGFIGLVYNTEFPKFKKQNLKYNEINQDLKDWGILWNKKYQKTISIKDSIRDTYSLGILKTFRDELNNNKSENIENIFNYGNENDQLALEHINQVKNNLKELKKNIFGFENDSGKEDIINNKIGIYYSWSGDAVYSIKKARQQKINLHFNVPNNGMTNIWFDQWIMTKHVKNDSKKIKIAHEFLNFISDSKNVIKNTKKIGYTSSIASKEIFNFFKETYEEHKNYKYQYDLNYFFQTENKTEEYKIFVSEEKIDQLKAQFPESKNIKNLMMMNDFGQNNNLLLNMWNELKSDNNDFYTLIEIFIILVELGLFFYFLHRVKKPK